MNHKKIEFSVDEMELIRYTLQNHNQELVEGLKLGSYTGSGIDKVTDEITLMGAIQSKLLFDILI